MKQKQIRNLRGKQFNVFLSIHTYHKLHTHIILITKYSVYLKKMHDKV